LAKLVTGYLLIVKKDSTDIKSIKHTVSILEQVEANIVGFIFNYVNPKESKKHKMYSVKAQPQ